MGVLEWLILGHKPFGLFPAVELGEHGTLRLELVVHARHTHWPVGETFLAWRVHSEHPLIILDRLRIDVVMVGPAKAAWVVVTQTQLGFAVHHPARQFTASARTPSKADRRAGVEPIVLQTRRWAEQHVPVGGVGDRAVHPALDADFAHCGCPVKGLA